MALQADRITVAYRNHARDVRNYLQLKTGCRSTAEDLTQDTFIRLCNSAQGDDILDMKSYLFRIAHNLLIDHHRWTRRSSAPREIIDITSEAADELGLASSDPTAEETLQVDDELRRIGRSIAHLPESCQRIFWLSRWLGFRNHEIATLLGVCVSTVEKNLAKALRCCAQYSVAAD